METKWIEIKDNEELPPDYTPVFVVTWDKVGMVAMREAGNWLIPALDRVGNDIIRIWRVVNIPVRMWIDIPD